ncbi:MAG: hypothetical protein ACR2H0_04970 [Candidatus Limnocylindrales bacterium]
MFSLRLALTFAVLILALSVSAVLAVDPTPASSGILIDPLDPRAGAGANRVGAPLLAMIAVIVIGAVAAVVTGLYVRLTRAR